MCGKDDRVDHFRSRGCNAVGTARGGDVFAAFAILKWARGPSDTVPCMTDQVDPVNGSLPASSAEARTDETDI
jgi:hypothetical protein